MAYATTRSSSGRVATMAAVGVLHIAGIYALVTGLSFIITKLPEAPQLQATNTRIKPPPPPDRPRDDHPKADHRLADPVRDPVPLPSPVATTEPLPTASGSASGDPFAGTGEGIGGGGGVIVDPVPPPLPPRLARPRGDRMRWVTTNDYPSQDLRMGNEGLTGYRLTVDAAGRVSGCAVTRSSGSPSLDAAACRALTARARFDAATDGSGARVEGSFTGTVRWTIPQ